MIQDIQIMNYRSVLGPCKLDLNNSVTVLIGGNEAGKSNILNAISRFDEESPVTTNELSNYQQYSTENFDSIEINRFILDEVDTIDWLAPPYIKEDLPFVQPDTFESNCVCGYLLKHSNPEIISYASGNRAIDFDFPDELSGIFDSEIDNFPMDLEEFRSKRESELVDLAAGLFQDLTSDPSLVFLNDETDIEDPTGFDEVVDGLAHIEETFNEVSLEDSSDVSTTEPLLDDIEISSDDIITGVSKLNTTLNEVRGMQNIDETLPKVVEQMDISLADSTYNILEDRDSPVLEAIFELGDVSMDKYETYDSEELRSDIELGCQEITRFLYNFWEFDVNRSEQIDELKNPSNPRYTFDFKFEEREITFFLKEEGRAVTKLGQRSDGMRWIITFLCQILAKTYAKKGDSIILLDDPGIHLHPEAEKKLKRAFDYVAPEAQVVYSTHSPTLINSKEPDQLRIVSHEGPDGTSVTSDFGEARDNKRQLDWLSVVREALGWYWSDFLYTSGQTVIVEAIDDKRYFDLFNQLFVANDDRPSLDSDSRFVSGGGDRLTFLSRILAAEDIGHIILRDDDKSDESQPDVIESRTHYYKDIDAINDKFDHDIEIEDLLNRDLVIDVIVDKNEDLIEEDELREFINVRDEPVMDVIEDLLSRETGSDEEYWCDKGELSKIVCEEIRENYRLNEVQYEETADLFEEIISYIDSLFE